MKHKSLIINALWLVFAMVALCAILDMSKHKPLKNDAMEALKSARAGVPVPEFAKPIAKFPPLVVSVDNKMTVVNDHLLVLMDDGSVRWCKAEVK